MAMAFERAKIQIKSASVGTGIKVTLSKMKDGQAQMKFTISTTLLKEFDWADGDKLDVLIGTGEHHALIRLLKNNSVGQVQVEAKKASKDIQYGVLKFGHQPAFVDRKEEGRWCQFERLDDGTVEIVLPRWADETAPKKKADVQPANPLPSGTTSRQPQPPVSRNVTASIMGDPPANRREIMAKIGDIKA